MNRSERFFKRIHFRGQNESGSRTVFQPANSRRYRLAGAAMLAMFFTGVAQAQGTMDFSGAQTLMGTFKTFAMYAGAVICLAVSSSPEYG